MRVDQVRSTMPMTKKSPNTYADVRQSHTHTNPPQTQATVAVITMRKAENT